jgi:hypothetical protein
VIADSSELFLVNEITIDLYVVMNKMVASVYYQLLMDAKSFLLEGRRLRVKLLQTGLRSVCSTICL